mmetsp:Transcript_43420/g.72194  ORF Transcript_43420/g.72194 Transcript_43420/m.72194 type:complete len:240 (-) Transcript_43420:571-1290(-)
MEIVRAQLNVDFSPYLDLGDAVGFPVAQVQGHGAIAGTQRSQARCAQAVARARDEAGTRTNPLFVTLLEEQRLRKKRIPSEDEVAVDVCDAGAEYDTEPHDCAYGRQCVPGRPSRYMRALRGLYQHISFVGPPRELEAELIAGQMGEEVNTHRKVDGHVQRHCTDQHPRAQPPAAYGNDAAGFKSEDGSSSKPWRCEACNLISDGRTSAKEAQVLEDSPIEPSCPGFFDLMHSGEKDRD